MNTSLTVEQAAERLNVSVAYMYKLIMERRIPIFIYDHDVDAHRDNITNEHRRKIGISDREQLDDIGLWY